jgi:hypothetical protein
VTRIRDALVEKIKEAAAVGNHEATIAATKQLRLIFDSWQRP